MAPVVTSNEVPVIASNVPGLAVVAPIVTPSILPSCASISTIPVTSSVFPVPTVALPVTSPVRLPTNVAIPSHLQKHIYFEKQKKWKCYVFLNQKPKFKWDELEMVCDPSDHK
mgnify:CR=1 FL=1